MSAADPKRVLTTGSFLVLQRNPKQKPFVVFGNVPIADIGTCSFKTAFGCELDS